MRLNDRMQWIRPIMVAVVDTSNDYGKHYAKLSGIL